MHDLELQTVRQNLKYLVGKGKDPIFPFMQYIVSIDKKINAFIK